MQIIRGELIDNTGGRAHWRTAHDPPERARSLREHHDRWLRARAE